MTENAKIIAASILVGSGTVGISTASISYTNDNIFVPIIVGLVGVFLLVQAWTGTSVTKHAKKCAKWAKDYDKLDNRISDEEAKKIADKE